MFLIYHFDTTGRITVNNGRRLDYETNTRIQLRVVATANSAYGYTTVWVNLRDVNDNEPRCTQQRYVSAVWEGKLCLKFGFIINLLKKPILKKRDVIKNI